MFIFTHFWSDRRDHSKKSEFRVNIEWCLHSKSTLFLNSLLKEWTFLNSFFTQFFLESTTLTLVSSPVLASSFLTVRRMSQRSYGNVHGRTECKQQNSHSKFTNSSSHFHQTDEIWKKTSTVKEFIHDLSGLFWFGPNALV